MNYLEQRENRKAELYISILEAIPKLQQLIKVRGKDSEGYVVKDRLYVGNMRVELVASFLNRLRSLMGGHVASKQLKVSGVEGNDMNEVTLSTWEGPKSSGILYTDPQGVRHTAVGMEHVEILLPALQKIIRELDMLLERHENEQYKIQNVIQESVAQSMRDTFGHH
ncbi:MAG: hypothetical protein AAB728_00560 [Patescibacteria group bacterium]